MPGNWSAPERGDQLSGVLLPGHSRTKPGAFCYHLVESALSGASSGSTRLRCSRTVAYDLSTRQTMNYTPFPPGILWNFGWLPSLGKEVRNILIGADPSQDIAHPQRDGALWVCGSYSPGGLFRNWTHRVWLARHRSSPPGASSLFFLSVFFKNGNLSRQMAGGSPVVSSVKDVQAKVLTFIDDSNQTMAKPFTWTFKERF